MSSCWPVNEPSLAALAAAQDVSWAGVGPQFRQAMEMLIAAHKEDLRWFSKQVASVGREGTFGVDIDVIIADVDAQAKSNPETGIDVIIADVAAQTQCKTSGKADLAKDPKLAEAAGSELVAPLDQGESSHRRLSGRELVKLSQAPQPKSTDKASDAGEGAPNSSQEKVSIDSLQKYEPQETQWKRPSLNSNVMAGRVRPSRGSLQSLREDLASEIPVDVPEYDVTQYYHSKGRAQAIATSTMFGHLTLLVIGINAVYMGFDADHNTADSLNEAHWVFIIFENAFCMFFLFEWCVRFGAFNGKCNCLKDGWFKFDSFLLLIIVFETWIVTLILRIMEGSSFTFSSGPLRLLRLLRLARLVRIMRAFPELLTMVHGMMVAMRAVGSAMVLLVMALYAWGITMHSFLKDEDDLYDYWGTVTRCMMTLLANGAFGDSIGEVLRDIAGNGPALIAMLAFVVFASLTVLNMLVGVLCEVVTEVSHAEAEEVALSKLKDTVLVMLMRIDEDGGGTISRDELAGILRDAEALAVMNDLNISVHHFIDMTEMHFEEGDDMSIPNIMKLLVDNQGDRPTSVQDLCNFHEVQSWGRKKDLLLIQDEVASLKELIQNKKGMFRTEGVGRAFPESTEAFSASTHEAI